MGSAPGSPAQPQEISSIASFGKTVARFDASKIAYGRALRNATAVAIPLFIGFLTGSPASGVIGSSGALNVCFSDGDDAYKQRALRMLASSVLVAIAVMTGTLAGKHPVGIIVLATAWAFAAGMMVALNQTVTDLGVITLVTVVVYAAQPMQPDRAVYSGLLACAGGLLTTVLSLALWPVRRYEPELRALGSLYQRLSEAPLSVDAYAAPPATPEASAARTALLNLGTDHSIEAERYRSLFSQAERMRLSLLALARLRTRLERAGQPVEAIDQFFDILTKHLAGIANCLLVQSRSCSEDPATLAGLAESLRHVTPVKPECAAFLRDARYQMDALAGQVRSANELLSHTTPAGLEEFRQKEMEKPAPLRLAGWAAILRANLTFRSSVFRHAVRLSVCLAIGEVITHSIELKRAYWLPMTIAIVLKPDFVSTFSRGVLRVVGTLAGLAVASSFFHVISGTVLTQILIIFLIVFLLRSYGAANYGVFTAAISAYVVFLFALSGIAPKDVAVPRALNTIAGGSIALLAYWLWPTWERYQVAESLAQMIEAYRDYFSMVAGAYISGSVPEGLEVDQVRQAGRVARTNFEGSFDRLASEPNAPVLVAPLTGMLASSHRLIHSVMALEAGLYRSKPTAPRPALEPFREQAERILDSLADLLRGKTPRSTFHGLREAHHALVAARDPNSSEYSLLLVETDRLTNSINTLRDQILLWKGGEVAPTVD